MITGEYRNNLDEKGRMLVPSRVRNLIPGNQLVLTRGIDKCLWVYTPEEWNRIASQILDSSSVFKSKTRLLQRRIIAPAQECEIDKSGRINIPPTLRESAGLRKEVVLLAMEKYMEIWDEAEYNGYLNESEEDFLAAAEDLGDLLNI
ncbi:MAG: division/cell wall cluster transcriptional repressor MraZ [Spirochaetales bacterium]|uniref:Transcriptional regulator MraZ n=1 Tax=Candidatus Thalassospirochaeta sargassi TaxID=3119039 RepID=A0AAJ1IKB1_9SPIO|nr:division/cell wall cluster transcriptional repressor MraZ [Spirochaetales bacterium]